MSPLHSHGSLAKGRRTRNGYLTLAFSGGPKDVENPTSPSRGSPTKVRKTRNGYLTPTSSGAQKRAEMLRQPCILGGPQQRGTKSKVATSPLPSWGPQRGRKCYVRPMCSKIPNQADKIRSGYLTLACRGPKRGRKCYVAPAFSGVPNKGKGNQKWLPHPCLLGGPKEGGNATSPLHSRGSPTKGTKIKSGSLTLAFSGGPKEGGNAT